MDPDVALEKLRECLAQVAALDPRPMLSLERRLELALEAAELFQGLDEWLSNGGYVPREWRTVNVTRIR